LANRADQATKAQGAWYELIGQIEGALKTQPTTATVVIDLGGKEFKLVDASNNVLATVRLDGNALNNLSSLRHELDALATKGVSEVSLSKDIIGNDLRALRSISKNQKFSTALTPSYNWLDSRLSIFGVVTGITVSVVDGLAKAANTLSSGAALVSIVEVEDTLLNDANTAYYRNLQNIQNSAGKQAFFVRVVNRNGTVVANTAFTAVPADLKARIIRNVDAANTTDAKTKLAQDANVTYLPITAGTVIAGVSATALAGSVQNIGDVVDNSVFTQLYGKVARDAGVTIQQILENPANYLSSIASEVAQIAANLSDTMFGSATLAIYA
jgi:hypothetical protein